MMQFKEIQPEEIKENPFDLIGRQWMLVSAGNRREMNTMTASWGGTGILWGKNVAFVFIRPVRHTFNFTEREDSFTLCFFDEQYRDALKLCGSKSGRDIDKIRATGLTPVYTETAPYFEEAKMALICKKLYADRIHPESFLDLNLDSANYPAKDYHQMYVVEITKVLVK